MEAIQNSVVDTVKSSFNFTVDKQPLVGLINGQLVETDQYGLFRSDTGYIEGLKSISDRYVPHTTDDVLAITEAASVAFDDNVSVKCHFNQGHYVSVAPSDSQRRQIIKDRDNVFPRFMIRAGFDGKAFGASMGYYRDLCSNLSMMRTVSKTSVSIRHTSGLRTRMDELIDTFQTLDASWESLTEAIASMNSREVIMTEFLDQIYGQPDADSKRGVTVHKNRTEAIFRRLYREHAATEATEFPADFKVNAWLAYNAVQGYVQHDATRKTGFKGEFSRIIAANNDRAVRTAEKLALGLSV